MGKKILAGAVVILLVVVIAVSLPFIFTVGPDGLIRVDPLNKTIELINSAFGSLGSIKSASTPVTFTPGYAFSSTAIADKIPLSESQLCFSKGDFEDNYNFSVEDRGTYQFLVWNGESNQLASLSVLCHLDLEHLEDSFAGTYFENWNVDCSICENQGRCCVIALRNI